MGILLRAASTLALAALGYNLAACSAQGYRVEGDAGRPDAVITTGAAGRVGPVLTPQHAPPPITGGTLLVMRDGVTAVAADPDRDTVWVARLDESDTATPVRLRDGDEPGRLVEDDQGRVHVALRRGGAVVTIDPRARTLVTRRPVCAAPRGLAYDAEARELVIACGGGELVTLPRDGGDASTTRLGADLRDVILWQGRRYVTRFRAAELLELGPTNEVVTTLKPEVTSVSGRNGLVGTFQPTVAWRTFTHPRLGAVMLHQAASSLALSVQQNGYGASLDPGCSGTTVIHEVTTFDGTRPAGLTATLASAVLAVDAALRDDGASLLVAAPGNQRLGAPHSQLLRYATATTTPLANRRCMSSVERLSTPANARQVIAVAWDGQQRPVYQSREPAGIHVFGGRSIWFGDAPSVEHTGHTLFHMNAGLGLACASCHPEGGDDGRAWNFEQIGLRRTPSIRGALSATAPFHWDGDMRDMDHLMSDVFARRMGGGALAGEHLRVVRTWIDALPTFPASVPVDASSVERGRALFMSAQVGCAGCHAGSNFTNNQTVDVGTGGRFQVPPLRGVAWRAPYLHDGRAPALSSRLVMDRSDRHGRTSRLAPEQITDLVHYLETL